MTTIHRVKRLELPLVAYDWPFAAANKDRIAAHFAAVRAARPAIWNGVCLQCRNPRFEGDVFRTDYFRTDYATFLAWRDWNEFDRTVFHCFSAGALRSADGAFLLGRMAQHTANAGRVYFPSGTPDPTDIVGDHVDLSASVSRELTEETGLDADDYVAEEAWSVVDDGRIKACLRVLQAHQSAEELVQRIAANLSRQTNPELDAMVVARSPADISDAMPNFVQAYLADAFGQT